MNRIIAEKKFTIATLLFDVQDTLVARFFDEDSNNMLDEKIDVLTKLREGIPPAEIPNYYDILEKNPENNIRWD